ncbi:carboxymuconolactone decarboxylase family protein [uncultured Lacinutrix sp.]|uniref:carboxymuconolactone decarboxylase family protein n=1 Tax=uncultured Lacinutrix sp. TaxID=574032 RepID=UPI0026385C84|nr:peroxidase-related enzyme [uncultured Lacinutrix sp.]
MSWIKVIPYSEAKSRLKTIYDKVKGPNNNVDNILAIHSLRPHSLIGHMALYKNVLHNSNNTLPKWYLETIGVYVSYLNKCSYCVDHHFAGLSRLLDNDDKSKAIFKAVEIDDFKACLNEKYMEGLQYAKLLTLEHTSITESNIEKLRTAGFTDGEVLELNQVASYFNYVNRTVLGLGVNTKGDIIGLSPNNSDDPDNWSHS